MPDRVKATPSQLPRGTPRKNASSLAIPSVHWVQTAFFSQLLIRCSHVAYVLVEENYLPQPSAELRACVMLRCCFQSCSNRAQSAAERHSRDALSIQHADSSRLGRRASSP